MANNEQIKSSKPILTQNIHSSLAMYHCDGLQCLLHPDEEDALYEFLTDHRLIAAYQQVSFVELG